MLFDRDIDRNQIEKQFDYIVSKEEPPVTKRSILSHSRAWKVNKIRNELRRINNGLLTDQEKIDYLKNDLFWAVQDDKPTDKIVEALALLQENKIQDDRLCNSPIAQINGVIAFLVAVGLAATVFSFISLLWCGGSHSKFCEGGRVIPGAIADIFREPAHKPARVLPANIKAN